MSTNTINFAVYVKQPSKTVDRYYIAKNELITDEPNNKNRDFNVPSGKYKDRSNACTVLGTFDVDDTISRAEVIYIYIRSNY